MRRRARKNGSNEGFRSNPFVVLTDMTIGLTFFFAMFSVVSALANSQALLLVARQDRQKAVREECVKIFGSGTRSEERGPSKESRHTAVLDSKGQILAQIWENGNFQRIKIYLPMFQGQRNSQLTPAGRQLLVAMARIFKKHAREFAYLFTHGITEPAEFGVGDAARRQALLNSRERADAVYNVLVSAGAIAKPELGDVPPNAIASKYAISYGTGSELYFKSRLLTSKLAGRVDIVLFYTDDEMN